MEEKKWLSWHRVRFILYQPQNKRLTDNSLFWTGYNGLFNIYLVTDNSFILDRV